AVDRRLPPRLRGAAAPLRARRGAPQPHVVPLVQRIAGAVPARGRGPGGGEALLSAMATHKTSAWPLAGAYVLLVVYASLYPFANWRDQQIPPWDFLFAEWPRYWTAFDLGANVVGYIPLGFLVALSFI